MRRAHCLVLITLALSGLGGRADRAGAEGAPGGCRSFAETWQPVCGPFLQYWQIHGGLAQQGYPLSPELTETSALDGRPYTVQYFERAIFERHPENAPPYDVLLTQLGTLRYRAEYPQGAPGQRANPNSPRVFPQTGHTLGGLFRAYWETHGGLAQQGYPLSDEFTEVSDLDGRAYTVQYFERAVFEWHPENAAPAQVLLSQLGRFRAESTHPRGFRQQGMNVAAWWNGTYTTPQADAAIRQLAALGVDSLAVVATGYQTAPNALAIDRTSPRTPTDADLRHVIALAHSLGLRVLLKPHLDLADGTWRGEIGQGLAGEADWQAWFTAYRAFVDHYADLATETGAEMLCIGTELKGTSGRAPDWRALAAEVRGRFAGPLVYAANYDETGLTWWDAVDYIGIDAYYPLADGPDPGAAALARAWETRGYLGTLAALARQYGRPVLLAEIGYRSIAGAAAAPVASPPQPKLDPAEQADAYHAALVAFRDTPWLAGIYWWNWELDSAAGGPADDGFTPQGKPAADILKQCYQGDCPDPAP